MAFIRVMSLNSGEISDVPKSAYETYMQDTGLYKVVDEPVEPVENQTKVENKTVEVSEKKKAEPELVKEEDRPSKVTPVKPYKSKSNISKVNQLI